MNRTVEALITPLVALGITAGIVLLILLIFVLSGQEQLLVQMVQSTAKGEFLGVAFTAGGPFGMWIIATLLLVLVKRRVPPREVELGLVLRAQDPQPPYPLTRAEFHRAKCSYFVKSSGEEDKPYKDVEIHCGKVEDDKASFDHFFIYVPILEVEKPVYKFRLEYEDNEWKGDSYSPWKSRLELHHVPKGE